MRIVGGTFKGRPLTAPKGRATRPTSDRTREAVFNILAHADWAPDLEGARVIDLFAGSGALGFEALSRGASFCLFVETDAAARGAIRDNAERMDVLGRTRVHRRDATHLGDKPAGLGAPFDIAFSDAPYGQGLTARALTRLADGGWLSDAPLVVVETGPDDEAVAVDGYVTCETRRYGPATVTFLVSE